MPECVQVITTTDSRDAAVKIARSLVMNRLAACVQIDGPIESHFHWEGKLESTVEWRCTAKTFRSVISRLVAELQQLHTYQTPEIVTIAMQDVSPDYVSWMTEHIDL
jgi:periplasmic divalent cation tolerance protein